MIETSSEQTSDQNQDHNHDIMIMSILLPKSKKKISNREIGEYVYFRKVEIFHHNSH